MGPEACGTACQPGSRGRGIRRDLPRLGGQE